MQSNNFQQQPAASKILSAAEAKLLISQAQKGNLMARNKLLLANQKLIYFLIKKYPTRGVSFEDLVAEANLGLMKAIQKFDSNLGNRFSTYASWWIRDSLNNAANKYVGRLIKQPGAKEAHAAYRPVLLSLEDENNSGLLAESLENTQDNPLKLAALSNQQKVIQDLCRWLTAREKLILAHEFNFNGRLHKTQAEVCKYLNITYNNYMTARKKLFAKLKRQLKSLGIQSLDDI